MNDEESHGQSSPKPKITAQKVLTWMGILACGSIITASGLFIVVFTITIIQQATIFKNGLNPQSQDEQDLPCGANPTPSCKAAQICNHWHQDWGDPPSYCSICTFPDQCVITDEEFSSIKLGVVDEGHLCSPEQVKQLRAIESLLVVTWQASYCLISEVHPLRTGANCPATNTNS